MVARVDFMRSVADPKLLTLVTQCESSMSAASAEWTMAVRRAAAQTSPTIVSPDNCFALKLSKLTVGLDCCK
jgi:hypothetical protein